MNLQIYLDSLRNKFYIPDISHRFNPYDGFVLYPNEDVKYIPTLNYMLIEADIKSAYPTFLKLFFYSEYSELINQIENEKDKLKRNILISTCAQELIPILQSLCKIFLLSFLMNKLNLVEVIEFKKDGGVFLIPRTNLKNTQFMDDIYPEIIYKVKNLEKYYRFNNTSLYYYCINELVIKGKLKHIPETIINYYQSKIDNNIIKDLYSFEYYIYLISTKNIDKLKQLYITTDNLYMNQKGTFSEYKNFSNFYSDIYEVYFRNYIEPFLKLN